MSRTKKGKKFPGTDFWGKRAMSACGTGKVIKKITHSKERAANKQIEHKLKKDQR
jgi:hypothetical protein